MCNLYSQTSNRQAIIDFTSAMAVAEIVGNLEPQIGIFPDYLAPLVPNFGGMRQLTKLRWGLPSSQRALFENVKKRAAKLESKGQVIDFEHLLSSNPIAALPMCATSSTLRKVVGTSIGTGGWASRTAAWCLSPRFQNSTAQPTIRAKR